MAVTRPWPHALLTRLQAVPPIRGARRLVSLLSAVPDRGETMRQLDRLLRDALPLLLVSCAVVGGICAMQGLGYVARYSASEVFGWAVGMSAFRDVGPLLLGCAIAARTGTRNTAEVAMMAAREQLDAVRALGLDPLPVLVAPRLWATVLVAALVYFPATSLVLITAFVLATAIGDQSLSASVWSFLTYMKPITFVSGLLRMALFGAAVGMSSCLAGLAVGEGGDRSAGAIGRAVYAGSVAALCGVVVTNAVLALTGRA